MSDCGDCSMTDESLLQIWNCFNKQRLSGTLCDATLIVGRRKFPVHRSILAANSPYFRALFTNGMRESEETVITIPLVDERIMNDILTYVYTRSADITKHNVKSLLAQADNFMIQGLVNKCCDFLVSSLNPNNCIGVMKFAENYYRPEVAQKALKYIYREFEDIASESTEYLNLEPEEFLSLISSDRLNVSAEERVWEASLWWVEYKSANRIHFVPQILSSIRLARLRLDYFESNVFRHPYVDNNLDCTEIIGKAFGFITKSKRWSAEDLCDPIVRPRVPEEVLFINGGWSGGGPVSFLESYDNQADQWFSHPNLESTPKAYHGMVALDGYIYILGGFDGNIYYSSVKRFDPEEKTWKNVAPMYYQRCYVSATVADGMIYAVGGYDGRVRLDTVERYVPKTNQWTQLPNMIYRRSDASAASIKDKVYVVGGFDGDTCLNYAEVFDPNENQWTKIDDMNHRRSGVSLIHYRGYLYALGGYDGQDRLKACERYCRDEEKWREIRPMTYPKSNFASAVLNRKMIAIGGFNGLTTVSSVESYDPVTDEWRSVKDLKVHRSALKACVVDRLRNSKDYTHYGSCDKVDNS